MGGRRALERSEMVVEDVVWWSAAAGIGGAQADAVRAPLKVNVQIRHRHAARAASVFPMDGGRARVCFEEPERAIAPGQAAVFYDEDRIVGGGFIA